LIPLCSPERPAVHDFANHVPAADFFHAQFDQPVRKQDAVATVNFSRQRCENCIYARRISQNLRRGDYELLARTQQNWPAARQRSRSNFRSLQVRQDGNRFFMLDGSSPQRRNIFRVLLVGTMRKIQPRHVHARAQQAVNHLGRTARRTDGAHYFGMTETHASFKGTDCRLFLFFTGTG